MAIAIPEIPEQKQAQVMNIFAKLQEARVRLAKMNLKKGGLNSYSKFSYYELSDFLPQIQEILLDLKMAAVCTFDNELATLTIHDAEDTSQSLVFSSPMRDAELKGNHAIQNLGAVETYQRRYLYMMAFEIVETDVLDLTHDKTKEVQGKATVQTGGDDSAPISAEMLEFIKAEIDVLKVDYEKFCKAYGVLKIEDLKGAKINEAVQGLAMKREAVEKANKKATAQDKIAAADTDTLFGNQEKDTVSGYAELEDDNPFVRQK